MYSQNSGSLPEPGLLSQEQAAAGPPGLRGRVEWQGPRETQASGTDIVTFSTVELIDLTEQQTVKADITDASGGFDLGTVSAPPATHSFTLEAIKGLRNHRAGNEAVRLRLNLLPRYVKGGSSYAWESPVAPTAAGLVIGYSSTAIAIAHSLRGGTARALDLPALVGRIEPGKASPETGLPDTYDPPPSGGLALTEFRDLWLMTWQAVATDRDPVEAILMNPSTFAFQLPLGIHSVTRIEPAAGPVGTVVKVVGTNFIGSPAGANQVLFNDKPGVTLTANVAELTVKVPEGATTGPVTVRIGNLVAVGPDFVVR